MRAESLSFLFLWYKWPLGWTVFSLPSLLKWMNFSRIGCSHLECADLHIRSLWLSVFSASGLMHSEDTKEIKCVDSSCVFSVDHEIDFFFFFFFSSCISQYQKLASFDYTNAHVIGNTWLVSVLIQQCLRISALEDWPVKLCKLDFEIFAFGTFWYSLVFLLFGYF